MANLMRAAIARKFMRGLQTISQSRIPAFPQFPISKGLTGSAIRDKKTVVVGNVRNDPRYLTTFGNTLSEIIIPVRDKKTGAVVGTIDVESEEVNAFSGEDQRMLEDCASAARPLWVQD